LDRYSFNSSLIESGLLVLIPDTSKTATLPSQQSPIDGFKLVLGANDFDMVGTNEGILEGDTLTAIDGKGEGLLDGAIDSEGEEDDTNVGCVDVDGSIDGILEGLILTAIVGNWEG